MNAPRIHEREGGGLVFDGLAPWYIALLLELPGLLAPRQPDEVEKRLFPPPSDDEDHAREWRKLVHPELFALLASAREIVRRDLASLAPHPGSEPTHWRLEIPEEHVPGWLSALNAARLALGARHRIQEPDMEGRHDADDVPDERQIAVVKIHLLGLLQQMILEKRYPPPEEEADSSSS